VTAPPGALLQFVTRNTPSTHLARAGSGKLHSGPRTDGTTRPTAAQEFTMTPADAEDFDADAVFSPTPEEITLLLRLAAEEPIPFPEDIKLDFSDRLYENGFITVGVNGGLALSEHGRELIDSLASA